MKKIFRFVAFALMLSLGCAASFAQTSGSNSPYSRYGWGNLSDEAMGFNKGMAGLGLGARDASIINRQNPASYSEVSAKTLLFDIGISLQAGRMKAGGGSVSANNSTLDYVASAFSLGKNFGFSLGLRPFSVVGYDFKATTDLDDVDGYGSKTTTASYKGDGGVRQLYAGIGWKPISPLSVGMNVNYLWGDYSHSSSVSYSESSVQTLVRTYSALINTVTLDFGLQYEQRLGKKDRVILGLTYGMGRKVNNRARFANVKSGSGTVVGGDTTFVNDAFELPTTLGAGFTWTHANQITVGLDYTLQMWQDCRFPELNSASATTAYKVGKNSFANRHKFVVGAEFIPNPQGMRISDHICYRVGAAYTTPYTKINGHDGPKSYLVTMGVGLPIVNRHSNRSSVNVSAQWEHVDASALKSVKEDYFRLCLGLNFNAEWFSKWKVR